MFLFYLFIFLFDFQGLKLIKYIHISTVLKYKFEVLIHTPLQFRGIYCTFDVSMYSYFADTDF